MDEDILQTKLSKEHFENWQAKSPNKTKPNHRRKIVQITENCFKSGALVLDFFLQFVEVDPALHRRLIIGIERFSLCGQLLQTKIVGRC